MWLCPRLVVSGIAMPPGSPGSRISRYCKVVHQHHHDSEHGESNSNFVFIAFHYHGYNKEQLIGPLCGLGPSKGEIRSIHPLASLDRHRKFFNSTHPWSFPRPCPPGARHQVGPVFPAVAAGRGGVSDHSSGEREACHRRVLEPTFASQVAHCPTSKSLISLG